MTVVRLIHPIQTNNGEVVVVLYIMDSLIHAPKRLTFSWLVHSPIQIARYFRMSVTRLPAIFMPYHHLACVC